MEGRCAFSSKPNRILAEKGKEGCLAQVRTRIFWCKWKSWAWLAGPASDQWRVVDWEFWWSCHSISHSDPSETWNSGPACGGATFFRRCGAVIPTKSTLRSQWAKLRNSGGPRSPSSTNYPGKES